jgi:hypothetical protein
MKQNEIYFLLGKNKGRADLIQEIKDKVAAIPEGETGEYFLVKILRILKDLK